MGHIALLELLVQSPLNVRTPGLILYPVILFSAYRWGFVAGMAAAVLGMGYLLVTTLVLGRPIGPPSSDTWRLGVVTIGIPAAAAVVGLLRDRFDRLLVKEGAARAAVKVERENTALILDSITDGVIALNRDWNVTYANRVAEELLRKPREELLGRDVRALIPHLETNVFYKNYERALNDQVPVHFEAASHVSSAWFDVHAYPSAEGLTVFFRDITERHQHEEKLRGLSMLDELTGLYNRRGFFTLAHQHCKQAERKRRGLLLVFIDVDGLKQINDTLGHVVGDTALVTLASALRHSFRESDILARLGGDEFAALVLEADPEIAPIPLRRLLATLDEFNRGGTLPLPLSVSIGMAFFDPDHPRSIDSLLAIADGRMYARKREKAAKNEL